MRYAGPWAVMEGLVQESPGQDETLAQSSLFNLTYDIMCAYEY